MAPTFRRLSPSFTLCLLLACGGNSARDPEMNAPTATLKTMTLTVDRVMPALGQVVIATARGQYSDGTEKDLVDGVTWRSSNPALLEAVSNVPGQFVAKAEGSADIIAT